MDSSNREWDQSSCYKHSMLLAASLYGRTSLMRAVPTVLAACKVMCTKLPLKIGQRCNKYCAYVWHKYIEMCMKLPLKHGHLLFRTLGYIPKVPSIERFPTVV